MIAVPLQSKTQKWIVQKGSKLICPHQVGGAYEGVVTPEKWTLWCSCPLSVPPVVLLLSRGQRGKPVKMVLPCSVAQKLAKVRLVLGNPHVNFQSRPMTTSHHQATENSTPMWLHELECYPQCPGASGPGPSVLRLLVGSSESDPERLRRPWS